MSDWEDDDFGGFESADIADVGAVQGSVASPDVANLVQSPKETVSGDGAQSEILDWILSNTSKTDTATSLTSPQTPLAPQELSSHVYVYAATPSSEKQTSPDGMNQLDSSSSVSHAEQLKDRLNDSAEIAKNLDDIFADSSATEQTESVAANWSADFSEAQKNIQAAASQEPGLESTVDKEALHKLQAELDAALVMKEQSEKLLETVQEELKDLTGKRKKDLEESSKKHEEEIATMKIKHKEEINELQKISEETIAQVTKQFSEIWKVIDKEKLVEAETIANSIVEKCLGLMNQQKETLSQKLEDNRMVQEKLVKEALEKERENMQKDIQDQLEKERQNLEKVLEKELKEKMQEEAEKQQELHTATLKEAMQNQQTYFEEVLQSTLTREKEKFAETLRETARDARTTTEKAAEERRKVNEKRERRRAMSMKMFLTSALQQLDFCDGTDEDDQAKGDSS